MTQARQTRHSAQSARRDSGIRKKHKAPVTSPEDPRKTITSSRLASSGLSENKGLGGVSSLSGSQNLVSVIVIWLLYRSIVLALPPINAQIY